MRIFDTMTHKTSLFIIVFVFFAIGAAGQSNHEDYDLGCVYGYRHQVPDNQAGELRTPLCIEPKQFEEPDPFTKVAKPKPFKPVECENTKAYRCDKLPESKNYDNCVEIWCVSGHMDFFRTVCEGV